MLSLQRAEHLLQKLRTATPVKEQKGFWIPSTENSEFCIAPVHSQQMGHCLWREPRTSRVYYDSLGWNTPGRQGYCQRVSYCLCVLKMHPDETHACALPSGAQTQHETNKIKKEPDLGLIWWNLQMEWRRYPITAIPRGSIREEHANGDSAGRAPIMGQIFPLAYLGNDSTSAFAYSRQAWKRDSKKSACERHKG